MSESTFYNISACHKYIFRLSQFFLCFLLRLPFHKCKWNKKKKSFCASQQKWKISVCGNKTRSRKFLCIIVVKLALLIVFSSPLLFLLIRLTLLRVYEINKVEEMTGFCVLHFYSGVITVVRQNCASFMVIKSTTLGFFYYLKEAVDNKMIQASLCEFF